MNNPKIKFIPTITSMILAFLFGFFCIPALFSMLDFFMLEKCPDLSGKDAEKLNNFFNIEYSLDSNSKDTTLYHGDSKYWCNTREISPRIAVNNNQIPPEICKLSNLRLLDLSKKNLSGNIPECIFNSKKLTALVLAGNSLEGNIPKSISNLQNLDTLNLSSNRLSGNIPKELGNIKSLFFINLSNNRLSGIFPKEIGELEKIQYLDLSENSLTGSTLEKLKKKGILIY